MNPEEMSVEQLIDGIEKVRAQRAELEKKERQMTKTLQLKASLLKQRMEKLLPGPTISTEEDFAPSVRPSKPSRSPTSVGGSPNRQQPVTSLPASFLLFIWPETPRQPRKANSIPASIARR
jgi:hypothetical protein